MNDNTGTTWTVDSQTPRTKVNRANQVEDGFEVAFTTGQGHSGTVFVPESRYNRDTVRAMIAAKAELIDGVGALSSDG